MNCEMITSGIGNCSFIPFIPRFWPKFLSVMYGNSKRFNISALLNTSCKSSNDDMITFDKQNRNSAKLEAKLWYWDIMMPMSVHFDGVVHKLRISMVWFRSNVTQWKRGRGIRQWRYVTTQVLFNEGLWLELSFKRARFYQAVFC